MELKKGTWVSKSSVYVIMTITESTVEHKNLACIDFPDDGIPMMSCPYELGDFGPAKSEIAEATGVSNYNFKMSHASMGNADLCGIVNEKGDTITRWSHSSNCPDEWHWTDDEGVEKLKEDRDHVDTPSCPHITPKPGKAGKLIWMSGPPGSGKSTTCQLMAREKDFVYFEADCVMAFLNPFVDPQAENPTLQAFRQKPLKGLSAEDFKAIQEFSKALEKFMTGDNTGLDVTFIPFLMMMARQIKNQRQRLGGHWAIAQAVMNRNQRNILRQELGPDLYFIVLNMTKECQKKRITGRHGENSPVIDMMLKWFELYEPGGEDEPRTINVSITEDMTRDDVLNKVLEVVDKI